MAHIFISYAHADWAFAQLLKDRLEKTGLEMWIDTQRLQAGENWRDSIDTAIAQSFALIAIMTPKADQSKYVTYEWACAWGAGKDLIPILLEKTDLHPRLDVLQYLDFSNPKLQPWDELITRMNAIQQAYEDRQAKRKSRKSPVPNSPSVPLPATQNLVTNTAAQDSEVRELIKKLKSSGLYTYRIEATHHLGGLSMLGNQDALAALMIAAGDSIGDVRKAAAQALGTSDNPAAVRRLISMLSDSMSDVSHAAASSLEGIGTPEALTALERWRKTK